MWKDVFQSAIEIIAPIVFTAIGTVLTVLLTQLIDKMKKKKELEAIAEATVEVRTAVLETVEELEQTTVPALRLLAENGKLTKEQIAMLKADVLMLTLTKLSSVSQTILTAASIDLNRLIESSSQSWLAKIKAERENSTK